jgi:hypothetical protein
LIDRDIVLNGTRHRKDREQRARRSEKVDERLSAFHPPEDEPDGEREQHAKDEQEITVTNHPAECRLNLQEDMTVRKEDDHDQRGDDARLLPFLCEQSQDDPDQCRAKKRQQDRSRKRRRVHVGDVEIPQFENGGRAQRGKGAGREEFFSWDSDEL